MTHAYKGSLIIHRVCEKDSDYPKYGIITNTEMRGYIVDVRDMFITDMFLNINHFTTYAHGHQRNNFNRYRLEVKEKKRQQMIKEREEYKKKILLTILSTLFSLNIVSMLLLLMK